MSDTYVDAPTRAPGAGRWRAQTRLGRVATWLAGAFVLWFVLNQAIVVGPQALQGAPRALLIGWGLAGLAVGALGGVVALVAIVRKRERGLLVFAAVLPLGLTLAFLLGELLLPH